MRLAEEFFATARERYSILLRRRAGVQQPWTEDRIFRQFSFCNVRREDDRTTTWFRDNIREPLRSEKHVLLATVAFRWFNRIATGERLLPLLLSEYWDTQHALQLLRQDPPVRPVVTGAYIVLGTRGYNKAEGVCRAIGEFYNNHYFPFEYMGATMQEAHERLCKVPYMGGFMAYEVVTDLRHTALLNASDRMTWACMGPGATRGLSRVVHGEVGHYTRSGKGQALMLEQCEQLLAMSQDGTHWPVGWPAWEMREVEHWLCEFDKYQRAVEEGAARMKRKFKPSEEVVP